MKMWVKLCKYIVVSLALMGLTSGFVQYSYAQDDGAQSEPFLQSDFNILLGDVLRPNGIYWHEGNLFTGCAGDWTIYRIDGSTGETVTYMFGVKNTHSLFVENVDDEAIVWAADFQENQVVRVDRRTGLEAIHPNLGAPWGLIPSEDLETFYVTQWETDDLIQVDRLGENIDVILTDLDDPAGMALDENILYVANNGDARRAVEWIDLNDEDPQPQGLVSGLSEVTNVILGPDNLLYMAYALGNRGVVGRVDPIACRDQGGCANVDVELVVWTELPAPLAGLVVTPDMRLYVHTLFGTEIYWLDLESRDTAGVTNTE